MRRSLLAFIFFLVIILFKTPDVFASTLFSDDLKTSYSAYTQFFGSCPPTSNGYDCNSALRHDAPIQGLTCVSADFNNPQALNSYIAMSDDVTGIDSNATWLNHHIVFRINYGGHPDIDSYLVWPPVAIASVTTPSLKHNYMFCKNGDTFTGYIDGDNVVSYTEQGHNPATFAIGGALGTQVSNLVVSDSLPTPTPTQPHLTVPSFKQNAVEWKNETYDLANLWSPTDDTIGTWGCALTSATMVLNYYNITNLPGFGNTPLNPYTLGQWLDTQPDGYIPNGNVNWLAISRLSKLAKSNNSTLLDALEYKRSNFADTTTLLADLNANHPDILEEPGHFVVATGQSGSTYSINDPYYTRTDLTSYGNTFLSLGRFVPSFTDLSYILFTADPSLTVTLKDSNNNPVGTSYVQQPLTGAETGLTAGNPIQLLYMEQPTSGAYSLTVSGSTNQVYTLKGYLYDKDGNVKPFTQSGATGPNNQNTITINFDNQNLTNDSTQKNITIETFLNDLTSLYNTNQIKKGGYKSLTSLGKNVQKDIQKHNKIALKVHLGVLKTLLGVDKKIGLLTDTAYQILLADVQYLQNY